MYSCILGLRPPNQTYFGSRSPQELLKASGLTQVPAPSRPSPFHVCPSQMSLWDLGWPWVGHGLGIRGGCGAGSGHGVRTILGLRTDMGHGMV